MSQENVEILAAAFRAFADGGLDAFAEYWTDDLEHRAIEGAPDDVGSMHGKDALRVYIRDWIETFENLTTYPVELTAFDSDTVIAVLRVTGRAKLSGVETDMTYAAVYTVRDGRIALGREYATRAHALAAVHLPEAGS